MSSPRVTGASDHNGRDAQTVSAWLMARGITAPAYTGQSEGREELEQALLENDVKALVATNALGMGQCPTRIYRGLPSAEPRQRSSLASRSCQAGGGQ